MTKNVTELDYNDKKIILIATAHVSKESAELVKQVIEEEKPDSICVELDEDRYNSIKNPKAWEDTDIIKVIKEKGIGFLFANLLLSSYQKKIAKNLGTAVGGEMMRGIESAEAIDATLVLADRKIQTTFLRIWRNLSLWEKGKLITNMLFSSDEDATVSEEDIEELMKADMLESMMSDLCKQFPKIVEVLINERDQYLAAKIKEAPGKKVVAILGGAHVPGVTKEIFRDQDVESISTVPKKNPFLKMIGWALSAGIIALLIYPFVINPNTGLAQLSVWVLWTGVLAALFTALSMAHPLSILTSLVAAPFTTINPLLVCGWFTGLVEVTMRRPTVQDIQRIPEDIFSFSGFFKNKFLRIILVVFMANLGASIGTFVAGADILKNLFQLHA